MMDYKYTIRKIDYPTADAIILELSDKLGRPVFDYRPGQYVMISYRNKRGTITDKHAFSLASSPTSRDHIQLGIKIHGNFSQGLAKMKVGDQVFVSGPFGSFTFNEKKHHDLVMIAGGIGITPFLSTIKYAADKHLPNSMSLLYSNRTLEGTLFFDEIKSLEERNKNFQSLFCVTNKKIDFINYQGLVNRRIDALLLADYLGPLSQKTFFICGPLSFMSGMKENLLSLGADREQIEMEEFSMIPATGFWAGVRNVSYVIGLSGLLLIAPLGLIYNSSAKAASKTQAGSSILSSNYYNTEKFFQLARKTYDQLLAEKQNGDANLNQEVVSGSDLPVAIGGLPVADEVAADGSSSDPVNIDPSNELINTITKLITKVDPAAKKVAISDNSKKTLAVAPAPKAAPSLGPKTAATEKKADSAPAPITSASGSAPAPTTSSVSTPTTATTTPSTTTRRNRHNEESDD